MLGSGDLTFVLLAVLGGAVALGLAIALIVVTVKVTGGILKAIGWLIAHIAKFVANVLSDAVRLVGAIVATLLAIPFATFHVVLARWESAGKWGRRLKRESLNVGYRSYSLVLKRPLELLCLDGILRGIEGGDGTDRLERSEEADRAGERNGRRMGPSEFEGYTIEGTLRPGGSGAKLYIASPDDDLRRRLSISSDRVVIKSFALEEGSSLPQIVRESRALDSARALGLVYDHGLDNGRFWYAMPYHPGESLGETARFLHARAGNDGLQGEELGEAIGYLRDLVATLTRYHEGGLWHKDVKPDNIIVHDGRAHLVDLGLVTPLRSAMTLTTHGTEYFRDPEMVRQALRGVRVHQVDGGKFDVYGAGAVLYFLLENTFPAHGGLSSFMKRSPEALRWIVRRAMADYHQRYVNARAMLDDLEAVARASDPWALRPIQLPSMRNADMEAVAVPAVPAIGAGSMAGGPHPGSSNAGQYGAGSQSPYAPPGWMGGAAAVAQVTRRPRLVVTNWWSGQYGASHETPSIPHIEAARAAREAARAAREVVAARRAARKASPSPRASAIGYLIPLALVTIAIVAMSRGGAGQQAPATPESALAQAVAPKRLAAPVAGTKLVLLNNHPALANPDVDEMVETVIASYEKVGFKVVRDDENAAAKLSLELAKQRAAVGDETAIAIVNEQSDVQVDAILAGAGYFGGIQIDAPMGDAPASERFIVKPLGSELRKAIEGARKSKSSKSSKSPKSESTGSRSSSSSSYTPPAPIPQVPDVPQLPPVSSVSSALDASLTGLPLSATLLASRPALTEGVEGSTRRFAWASPQGTPTARHTNRLPLLAERRESTRADSSAT